MSDFSQFDGDVIEEKARDYVGFVAYDTDIYLAEIKDAYRKQSDGGAHAIVWEFDLGGGKTFRKEVYFTDSKGKHYYMTKPQDGSEPKKASLPGFILVDDLCLIASGKPLKSQATEEKLKKIYNKDADKEIPTPMQTLTGLIGKKVALAITKVLENKKKKQGTEYVATAEEVEVNEIAKVLHPVHKVTVTEARETPQGEKPKAEYWDKWLKKNKGKTKDNRTFKTGPGGPPSAGSGGAVDDGESLFK
jgi:hypothetical protein